MECACTVETYDCGETVVTLDRTTPTARKPHTCSECSRLIPRGEEYRREVYVFEGSLFTHKYCEDCLSVRQVFFNNGWIYYTLWDDMITHIYESDGDLSVKCLLELTPFARGKILDLMEQTWECKESYVY